MEYHAYGDSITAGTTLVDANPYPVLIGHDAATPTANFGISADQACDVPTRQIFPNRDNPAASTPILYTLLIGTNDANVKGLGGYEAVFDLCHQASIAWLAVPADLKILATDPSVVTSGHGFLNSGNNWNAWVTTAQNSSITFPVNLPSPGPIYLWVNVADNDPGGFAYAVDGNVAGTFATATTPAIATHNGTSDSLGLIRIPNVVSGHHTVTLTQTTSNGTMQIVAVGQAPAVKRILPTVLVGNVPLQEQGSTAPCALNPLVCNTYSAHILANIALFAGDGLSVVFADNHPYMAASPSEMNDSVHPNPLGQSELRGAFEAAVP